MKKYVSFFFAAAAIFSVAACTKTVNTQEAEGVTRTVSFTFEEEELATKTSINVDSQDKCSVDWKNTPKEYVHLFENGVTGTNPQISISNDYKKAEVMATFPSYPLNYYDYRAVIAANYVKGVPSVPAVQTPQATSFDPKADVLIGKGKDVQIFWRDRVALTYRRPIAISRLTIKGLNAGETIEAVEVVASNVIAGDINLDPSSKDFIGYAKTGSKRILLKGDNLINNNGTATVFFTSWAVNPGETFIVRVKTAERYYQAYALHADALKFKEGVVTNIVTTVTNITVYEPVDLAQENWAGDYLIADELCNCTEEDTELNELYGTVKAFCWNAVADPKKQVISTVNAKVDSFAGKKVIFPVDVEKALPEGNEFRFFVTSKDSNWVVKSFFMDKSNVKNIVLTGNKEQKIVFENGPAANHTYCAISQEDDQTVLNIVKAEGRPQDRVSLYLGYDETNEKFYYDTEKTSVKLFKLNEATSNAK